MRERVKILEKRGDHPRLVFVRELCASCHHFRSPRNPVVALFFGTLNCSPSENNRPPGSKVFLPTGLQVDIPNLVGYIDVNRFREGFQRINIALCQTSESSRIPKGAIVLLLFPCGVGGCRIFKCRYARVIGADLSTTMLDETAKRFREDGLGRPELLRYPLPLRRKDSDLDRLETEEGTARLALEETYTLTGVYHEAMVCHVPALCFLPAMEATPSSQHRGEEKLPYPRTTRTHISSVVVRCQLGEWAKGMVKEFGE